ncbi:LysR family transcriptional regulator [Sphingomonas sp. BT-65]|nr:LysR family transcriptional regulator [Sphingomonas sp. BT-65]
MTLDLRNLRCALAAAETGSFRQAAAALDLPQSSVSRRVQARRWATAGRIRALPGFQGSELTPLRGTDAGDAPFQRPL